MDKVYVDEGDSFGQREYTGHVSFIGADHIVVRGIDGEAVYDPDITEIVVMNPATSDFFIPEII